MTILVVIGHADDECLGCGGAIAKHVEDGDEVFAMYFTTGLLSRFGTTIDDIHRRREHAEDAARVLGFTWYDQLGFPDNRMDSVDLLDAVQPIERAIDELKPKIVYTHHGGDLNIDHRQVHDAVWTATRGLPEQIVREVRLMEVPSSTEFFFADQPFVPNLHMTLTLAHIEKKIAALQCYADEVRHWPHPRSVEGVRVLAHYRGMCCGVSRAEAFNVVRRRV